MENELITLRLYDVHILHVHIQRGFVTYFTFKVLSEPT